MPGGPYRNPPIIPRAPILPTRSPRGFLAPPRVEFLDDEHARLLAPLVYDSPTAGRITVPAGFETDFASVPRIPFAYWLAGNTAHGPAIVHDWLYRTHQVSRRQADAVFYEAMGAWGMMGWRRGLMWGAVRAFGWSPWRRSRLPSSL